MLHTGCYYGAFLYHAHAHIQGTGYAFLTGSNGGAHIHVQVIDGIPVAGFHRCVFLIVYGGIGHRSNGRTLHPVGIHVIAGLKSESRRARYGAGHVKRRHGLLRVSRHGKVLRINVVIPDIGS